MLHSSSKIQNPYFPFSHSPPGKMSENKAEKIFDNIMEKINDNLPKQKSVRFFEEQNPVSAQMNKLFGQQKSIHKIFGGGKSADVLLWRNKKYSSSILLGATAVWVLFEWLNYHFLTILNSALGISMIIQFVWSNASVLLNRSPSNIPHLVLTDEFFVNVSKSIGSEMNSFLGFLQDVASGRDLKLFLLVLAGLWASAVIGSYCNFLTVLYIGFVVAHTLPVLYEKHEDKVDNFASNLVGQLKQQFRKIDEGVLSKIPKGNLKYKKME